MKNLSTIVLAFLFLAIASADAEPLIVEKGKANAVIVIAEDAPRSTRLAAAELQETIEKIFEPFYKTKTQGKGKGLGLSICYGIIEDHGGNLWAESEPGNGATFHVELPFLAEAKTGE